MSETSPEPRSRRSYDHRLDHHRDHPRPAGDRPRPSRSLESPDDLRREHPPDRRRGDPALRDPSPCQGSRPADDRPDPDHRRRRRADHRDVAVGRRAAALADPAAAAGYREPRIVETTLPEAPEMLFEFQHELANGEWEALGLSRSRRRLRHRRPERPVPTRERAAPDGAYRVDRPKENVRYAAVDPRVSSGSSMSSDRGPEREPRPPGSGAVSPGRSSGCASSSSRPGSPPSSSRRSTFPPPSKAKAATPKASCRTPRRRSRSKRGRSRPSASR